MGLDYYLYPFNLRTYENRVYPAYQSLTGPGNAEPLLALVYECDRLLATEPALSEKLYWTKESVAEDVGVLDGTVYYNSKGGLKTAIVRIRKRYFRLSPEQRVAVFVEMLRRASRHSTEGWPIGRNCMSSIQLSAGGWVTEYHPENADPVSYTPHYVGRQFTARDIWIRTDPDEIEQQPQTFPGRPNTVSPGPGALRTLSFRLNLRS